MDVRAFIVPSYSAVAPIILCASSLRRARWVVSDDTFVLKNTYEQGRNADNIQMKALYEITRQAACTKDSFQINSFLRPPYKTARLLAFILLLFTSCKLQKFFH